MRRSSFPAVKETGTMKLRARGSLFEEGLETLRDLVLIAAYTGEDEEWAEEDLDEEDWEEDDDWDDDDDDEDDDWDDDDDDW